MRKLLFTAVNLGLMLAVSAQTNPAIISWLQNTTTFGSHYVSRNSTVIKDNVLANVQKVQYSTDFVYINTHGIPAYPTGPFLDRNPSLAMDQNAIFKIPLNPSKNTGTPTASTAGNIGVFVNGVALFDYRDGVSYNLRVARDQGGPGGGRGDGICGGGRGRQNKYRYSVGYKMYVSDAEEE